MTVGLSRLFLPMITLRIIFFLAGLLYPAMALPSSHFSAKQIEALRKYTGKTYWVVAEERSIPLFYSTPSPAAPAFRPGTKESFQLTEMIEGSRQPNYYYRVKFGSGTEGYIGVDSFLQELNAAFVTQDPDRGKKIRSAKESQAESRREARIRALPSPEYVKEAAIRRQAVLGMNTKEARIALGKPARMVKIQQASPLMGPQEQWIYDSGPVLTFTNGLISRIQGAKDKTE